MLVLILALLTSGCILSTAALLPNRTRTEYLDATHTVEVRGVPDGAKVRTPSGELVDAPARISIPYRIERTGRRHGHWVIAISAAITLTALAYVGLELEGITDASPFKPATLATYALGVDLLSIAVIMPTWMRRNHAWRHVATERPVVATQALTIEWPGFAPATTSVVVPTQGYVTLRRPSLGTFDEALLRWDRTAAIAPSTKGVLELAGAYDRLVERTGDAAHAARAVALYEQYAAASDAAPAKIETARTRAAALRRSYQIR